MYEILSKQAQIILNLDSFSDAGQLHRILTKQNEYSKKISDCMDRKRCLLETLLSQQIERDRYNAEKAAIDIEISHLKQLHSVTAAQTAQMQTDEKTKNARTKLAQKITGANSLTDELADALIDRVYVYPGNHVEIVWKMDDFCVE